MMASLISKQPGFLASAFLMWPGGRDCGYVPKVYDMLDQYMKLCIVILQCKGCDSRGFTSFLTKHNIISTVL